MRTLTRDGKLALAIVALVLAAVLVWLLRPTTHAPTTYYVALNGNNSNSGTAASPWRNLAYAVARLAPGDRLCIGGGVWTGGTDVIDSSRLTVPSGTDFASGAITIGGCNGDTVIIKPPAGLGAIKLTVGAPHHLVFSDLTLDGSLQPDPPDANAGVPELLYTSSGTHHVRVLRVRFQHTMSMAIQFSASNSTPQTPTYHEVVDSYFTDIGNATGDSGHGGPGVNNGYPIYSFTGRNLIQGTTFVDNRGTALVVYGFENIVDGNVFTKNATRRPDIGYAVNFGSSSHPVPSTGNVFRNNVVYEQPGGGVQIYTQASVDVLNNTFYKNGAWAVHAQYCLGATIRNNIFRLHTADVVNDSPTTCALTVDSNVPNATDPQFVDPAAGDFHLATSASPAHNVGASVDVARDADGVTRPQSGKYDAGAYELPAGTSGGTEPPPSLASTPLALTLSNVVVPVTSKPATLTSLVCHNVTNARVFVQLFDAPGALRAGSDAPVWSVGIPGNQTVPLDALAVGFAHTLRAAAATTPSGGTAPSAPVPCNFAVR